MCWSSGSSVSALVILALLPVNSFAESDGYILGMGGESDTARGRAAMVFGDFSLNSKTWVSAALARTRTGGGTGGLDTQFVDAAFDYWFDPVGIRLGGGYWGDDRILDSNDLRASIYFRNDDLSIAGDYERREFDFTFGDGVLPVPRTIGFHSDGYGLNSRFRVSDAASMSLGGMVYNYSRNINLQPSIDILRIFSTSRLSLMNSLLDYRISAGVDYSFELSTIDLRVERWQTAIDQGFVDSIGVGLLTPMGVNSDMEFRFSYDHSDEFGETLTFSVFYYFFGG